ncbi:hypothetical protein COOONC_23232 [Cooperia oncophora]
MGPFSALTPTFIVKGVRNRYHEKPPDGEKVKSGLRTPKPPLSWPGIRDREGNSSSAETPSGWTAAVYSDHKSCSEVGRLILLRGGNAVDAAISTIFCLSAALPHRGGLGGGFMATIYSDSSCTTLNSRWPWLFSQSSRDRKQSPFLDFSADSIELLRVLRQSA